MITLGSLCIVFDGDAIIGTLIGEALMVFFLFFLPMLLLTRGRDAETTVNPRRSGGSTQGSCSFDAIFDTQTGNIGAGYYDVWGSGGGGGGQRQISPGDPRYLPGNNTNYLPRGRK